MAFFSWLWALLNHWQNWASGGGVGGFVLIVLDLTEVRLSKKAKWFIFLWVFTMAASFMAWKDMRDSAEEAKRRYDLNSPHMRCELDAITPASNATVYVDGRPAFVFDVLATPMILNSGSPSIARKFRMSITTSDKVTFWGESILINSDITRVTDAGTVTYHPSDAITEKANTPVIMGGEQTGLLAFRFRGIPAYSFIERDARVRLSFVDVNAQESSCELVTNGRNSHGLEAMPGKF